VNTIRPRQDALQYGAALRDAPGQETAPFRQPVLDDFTGVVLNRCQWFRAGRGAVRPARQRKLGTDGQNFFVLNSEPGTRKLVPRWTVLDNRLALGGR